MRSTTAVQATEGCQRSSSDRDVAARVVWLFPALTEAADTLKTLCLCRVTQVPLPR